MGAGIALTMAISVLLSSATIINWAKAPHRPLEHFVFVVALIGSVMFVTSALRITLAE